MSNTTTTKSSTRRVKTVTKGSEAISRMDEYLDVEESRMLRELAEPTIEELIEYVKSTGGATEDKDMMHEQFLGGRKWLCEMILAKGKQLPSGYEKFNPNYKAAEELVDGDDEYVDPSHSWKLTEIKVLAKDVFPGWGSVEAFTEFALEQGDGFNDWLISEATALFMELETRLANSSVKRIEHDGDEELALMWPAVDPSFYFDQRVISLFEIMRKAQDEGEYIPGVLSIGPPGSGKTEMWTQFAARIGKPVFVLDMQLFREPKDLFGMMSLESGENGSGSHTKWRDSQFTKILRRGDCVIVLDEITRCQPMVANALLPILDRRRSVFVEEAGVRIEVGKGIYFVSTANAASSQDRDVRGLPLALADRFATRIECGFAPANEEIKIIGRRHPGIHKDNVVKLVSFANEQRRLHASGQFQSAVSTRSVLNIAFWLEKCGDPTLAFEIGIRDCFAASTAIGGGTSERNLLKATWQGQFGE